MSTSRFPTMKSILLPGLFLLTILLAGCGSGGALAATSWPGLSIEGTTAYLAFNQAVFAIDLNTGNELWRFPPEPDRNMTFYAPPAPIGENQVVVGGYDNVVYALESGGGSQVRILWPFEGAQDRIIGGPVFAQDMVLVPSADNNLYALKLETGDLAWQNPFVTQEALWSAPLVREDTIYLASLDHHVYAIELSTGREIWRSEDLNGAIADTPTLAGNLLLVGTFGSQLVALNVEERGQIEWSFNAEGWVWAGPVVTDSTAYFGDTSGVAYAMDLDTGQELWRTKLDGAVTAKPALDDNGVYFTTETGTINAFEVGSNKPLWSSNPNLAAKLLADPVWFNGTLLVAAMESECLIFAVEAESGAVRCLFQPSQ